MRFTTKLLPSQSGNVGMLLLNHPKALNALTTDMVHCLHDVLQQWQRDATLSCILMKASAPSEPKLGKDGKPKRPAFCSGGDVKSGYFDGLYHYHGQKQDHDADARPIPQDFFFHEYQVNAMLANSKIPQVSLWNGIVMGGGVGLSVHGTYRVATEHSLFAMPETAIGLFPDVGSTWWMNRLLTMDVARYIALSGARLYAEDLIHTGLATHYVPSEQLPQLEQALVDASIQEDTNVAQVLMSFHQNIDTSESHLNVNRNEIQEMFGGDASSMEDIMARLQSAADTTPFASKTLETLSKMSPTSCKVTLEGLKRGANAKSITEALHMEYRMANRCVVDPTSDFYEGIRAVLVDKDHEPNWQPKDLADVTDDIVESYFAPIQDEWVPAAAAATPGKPKDVESASKL